VTAADASPSSGVHAPVTKRTGRPRRDGRHIVGDPTLEILEAAGRLFGEHGVENTPMSRIASEVGLGQSSLYYYFRSREDVVAALVAGANVVPLALARAVGAADASVPAKLHAFVRGDVEALCALPFDINEIHRIAGRDRERFASYWSERRSLERQLTSLVRAGTADRSLRDVDPRLAALTVLANDEGTQNWFRLRGRVPRPSRLAEGVADITVAGLLAPGARLEEVRASSFRITIETDTARSRAGNSQETTRP
jgi:TetR/AcrR family transcriptional regulator